MLTAFKYFLSLVFPPAFLFLDIIISIFSALKKAEWGLFFLVVMIPQPNIWYSVLGYPMGNNFIDFLFFGVLFGIFYQKKGFAKTDNSWFIIIFILVSYFALWNSSIRFSLPLPLTTSNELLPKWKNYAEMIFLYFLILNVVKNEDQQKVVVIIMTIVVLFISIRSYRAFVGGDSFSYDKRYGGPFETVGLGSNHLGAFIAYTSAFFLGLFFYDEDKKRKWLFLVTVLFSLHPLFFSYSRGAYLAALGVISFYGIMKKRSLLILVAVILLAWQTILPVSVAGRIAMTQTEEGGLEHSAGVRLILWQQAIDAFRQNPIFGVGFNGFGFIVPEGQVLTDTHNFYLKTLSEQGIIGIVLLSVFFIKALLSGWRLLRNGKTSFHRGLGFGFLGCVLCVTITNMFGDRWSYFMLNSYFWIFWGLVDRGILLSQVKDAQHDIVAAEKTKSVLLYNRV